MYALLCMQLKDEYQKYTKTLFQRLNDKKIKSF